MKHEDDRLSLCLSQLGGGNPSEEPDYEGDPTPQQMPGEDDNTERPPGDWQVVEDPLKRLDEIE